jgi:hypothetical protein
MFSEWNWPLFTFRVNISSGVMLLSVKIQSASDTLLL